MAPQPIPENALLTGPLPSCDKVVPGHLMAAGRLDIPAIVVTGGAMMAGYGGDKELDLISAFEAVGAHNSGKIDDDELKMIEDAACPGCGSCAGMFTANTMACMAQGLAPNALTSLYLANRAPVLIFPAMNGNMWNHPATQKNASVLLGREKHRIVGPDDAGMLACGAEGQGRLVPVERIVDEILRELS